jgi:glucan biosynthesis protein
VQVRKAWKPSGLRKASWVWRIRDLFRVLTWRGGGVRVKRPLVDPKKLGERVL